MWLILLIIFYYFYIGLAYYGCCAVSSYEHLGFWNFSIKDGYISGIFPYPKWLLYWLEWIVNKGWRKKDEK